MSYAKCGKFAKYHGNEKDKYENDIEPCKMIRCSSCHRSWPEGTDNAQCICNHGQCLRCRYEGIASCVTVVHELEPGLEDGNGI